eukprot:TRINITY_DN55031_c0_g1_i1.p1 TRINITY_DN55031_c0_g1~~TRINITY_DN55031_c0_g1_i1.p1  ORF type:complete len:372 (-),score=38.13 TRINITY_DN55031_c0_g1_i1:84-1199(-)
MPPQYTKAATNSDSGRTGKLQFVSADVPNPVAGEVLIHTLVAGICRSDVHIIRQKLAVPPPVVCGHEVLGRVEKVGEYGPKDLLGKIAIVYPWIGCGKCPECLRGDMGLCTTPMGKIFIGIQRGGGFAEKVLVSHFRFVIPIGNIDWGLAAALPCSGLTAYGAVKQAIAPPGGVVGVFGCGGVGLMVVQILKATTAAAVVAIDVSEEKINTAKEYGADFGMVVGKRTSTPEGQKDLLLEARKIAPAGFDSFIDTVGAAGTIGTGLMLVPGVGTMMRPGGKIVVIGLDGGDLTVRVPLLVNFKFSLCTAWLGTPAELHELVALAERSGLKSTVSRTCELRQINEVLEDLETGKVKGRAVVTYNDVDGKKSRM